MRRYLHVFFDATDTLLRVRGSVGQIYATAAHRYGFIAAPQAIDKNFRAALQAAPPACFPTASSDEFEQLERDWWHAVVETTFAPLGPFADFEPFFADVFEQFRSTSAWELLPEVRLTLARLRTGGRRLGIISEMDGRLLDVLEGFELQGFFDPIVLSTRAGAGKRDGALYLHALAAAGVDAARSIHVGDSLAADVVAARGVGITPIHFDPQATGETPPGITSVRSWSEIPAALSALEENSEDRI